MATYEIEREGALIILPATDARSHGSTTVYTWTDTEERVARWVRHCLNGRKLPDRGFRARVRLIPRPDNTYNSSAVSVSAEPSFGGDLTSRHLGYLPDRFLARLGWDTLPDLAAESTGEIGATVFIERCDDGEYELSLDVPPADNLGPVLHRHLGKPSGSSSGTKASIKARKQTDTVLAALRTFSEPHVTSSLTIGVDRFYSRSRTLSLTDDQGLRRAWVEDGRLFTADVRDRPAALAALREARVPVAELRRVPPGITYAGEWEPGAIPNAWMQRRGGGPDFRPRSDDPELRETTFAQFTLSTGVLWVEDDRLIGAAVEFAAHLGFDITDVKTPHRAWKLTQEVPHSVRKDETNRDMVHRHQMLTPELRRDLPSRLPNGLFSNTRVEWTDGKGSV